MPESTSLASGRRIYRLACEPVNLGGDDWAAVEKGSSPVSAERTNGRPLTITETRDICTQEGGEGQVLNRGQADELERLVEYRRLAQAARGELTPCFFDRGIATQGHDILVHQLVGALDGTALGRGE
jgi:hypothetical protein